MTKEDVQNMEPVRAESPSPVKVSIDPAAGTMTITLPIDFKSTHSSTSGKMIIQASTGGWAKTGWADPATKREIILNVTAGISAKGL